MQATCTSIIGITQYAVACVLTITVIQPCVGQTEKAMTTADSTKGDSIHTIVEQMPRFGMREHSVYEYIYRNVKYPSIAREEGIDGEVWIEFVISKEGKVQSPIITKGIGAGCDEEVLRIFNSMPKWTPGKHHGEAVNVKLTAVVNFRLK